VRKASSSPGLAADCLEAFVDREEHSDEARCRARAGARLIAEAILVVRRLGHGEG